MAALFLDVFRGKATGPSSWFVGCLIIGVLSITVSACLSDEDKCPKGSKLIKGGEHPEVHYFFDVCIVTLVDSPATDGPNEDGDTGDPNEDSDTGEPNEVVDAGGPIDSELAENHVLVRADSVSLTD